MAHIAQNCLIKSLHMVLGDWPWTGLSVWTSASVLMGGPSINRISHRYPCSTNANVHLRFLRLYILLLQAMCAVSGWTPSCEAKTGKWVAAGELSRERCLGVPLQGHKRMLTPP